MKKNVILLLAATALTLLSCQSIEKKPKAAASASNWPAKMQSLSTRLNNLLPFIYSKQKFESPAHRNWLSKEIRQFHAELRQVENHSLQQMPDHDPSLKITITRFTNDVESAHQALEAKNLDFSRSILKSSINYCYHCHSRNNLGPEYSLDFSGFDTSNLSPLEKTDYLVATRQFDRAIKSLEDEIQREREKVTAFNLELLIDKYLMLSVRVKKNPQAAIQTLKQVTKDNDSNSYLVSSTKKWLASLKEWKRSLENGQIDNELEQAKKLINQAKLEQEYPLDNSANVLYLRASALLYDWLQKDLGPEEFSETALLLGTCYELIRDASSWNLNEVYYEACIRRSPHSPLSEKCFERFERSLLIGYSGSSGLHLPMTARMQLEELRKLAYK